MKKFTTFICLFISNALYPCADYYEEIYGLENIEFYADQIIDSRSVDRNNLYFYLQNNYYLFDDLKKEASDLSVAHIYLRQYENALKISSKLIQKYPDEYNVVSTYATCLELNGRFKEALIYLKKANSASLVRSCWRRHSIYLN